MKEMDYSLLDERLTPYYESGERIEVVWKEGYEHFCGRVGTLSNGRLARFYVGRSTGWKPIYLMILNRNSIGGEAITSEAIEEIRGLGVYRWKGRY